MPEPVRRRRFPPLWSLPIAYLGIGTALQLSLAIYVRYFRADHGGPDPLGVFTAPIPLTERMQFILGWWVVPILLWPLIVIGWIVNLVRR